MQIIDRLKARKLLPIEQHAGTQLESTKKTFSSSTATILQEEKRLFNPRR